MQTILPATFIFSRWLSGSKCRAKKLRRCGLPRRRVLTSEFAVTGRILCLRGRLWITLDGTREDILLESGGSLNCGAGSRAVIEALEDSNLEINGI